MGTPFEIETAGRILFLEDVSERLYRIDRYLSQLRLAGKVGFGRWGAPWRRFRTMEGEEAEISSEVPGSVGRIFGAARRAGARRFSGRA